MIHRELNQRYQPIAEHLAVNCTFADLLRIWVDPNSFLKTDQPPLKLRANRYW